jgi:hypothetical protein
MADEPDHPRRRPGSGRQSEVPRDCLRSPEEERPIGDEHVDIRPRLSGGDVHDIWAVQRSGPPLRVTSTNPESPREVVPRSDVPLALTLCTQMSHDGQPEPIRKASPGVGQQAVLTTPRFLSSFSSVPREDPTTLQSGISSAPSLHGSLHLIARIG